MEDNSGIRSVSPITAVFLCLYGNSHFADSGLAGLIHDVDDESMLDALVGIDDYQQFGIGGQACLKNIADRIVRNRLFVDNEVAIRIDRQYCTFARWLLSCGGFGQIDWQAVVARHRQS